jgi:hypothetical protein
MKRSRLVSLGLAPLALIALLGLARPARLVAQDPQPSTGKIGDVERSADNAKKQGSDHADDDGDDGLGGFRFFVHAVWHAFVYVPRDTGQGYLSYPYATSAVGPTFVVREVASGRTFANLSATYFHDAGSTLSGMHFSVEWVGGMFGRTIEYSHFTEATGAGTDHLSMVHVGFAALPPVGDLGYLKVGLAFQGVFTDQGDAAVGPELVLGTQLLPKRPFGIAASVRLAPLTWGGGPAFGTGFVDLMAGGSVFLGRTEVQAGYRWTRVGVGSPFSGPTLGVRAWF